MAPSLAGRAWAGEGAKIETELKDGEVVSLDSLIPYDRDAASQMYVDRHCVIAIEWNPCQR